jgi:hypothetical protein
MPGEGTFAMMVRPTLHPARYDRGHFEVVYGMAELRAFVMIGTCALPNMRTVRPDDGHRP